MNENSTNHNYIRCTAEVSFKIIGHRRLLDVRSRLIRDSGAIMGQFCFVQPVAMMFGTTVLRSLLFVGVMPYQLEVTI